MADFLMVARPYAKAAFDYALKADTLLSWHDFLNAAALVIENAQMQSLLRDPRVATAKLVDVIENVQKQVQKDLSSPQCNFIRLLAENKRMMALPAIKNEFTKMQLAYEKTIPVSVISAFEIDAALTQKISDHLKKKSNRNIDLNVTVDASLIGGAIIRIGEESVIDASIKGRLSRLEHSLLSD